MRLRVLEDAGRVGVPFTTGILIGIGENLTERAESLFAIRRSAREYGHIQEVIVQNFRAKPDTAMRGMPDAELHDLAATIAVARLVLGPAARIQAPPNLIDDEYGLLLRAGIDDWGGVSPVTPDHVNPERPWPQIDELAASSAAAGFTLRERLTIYPRVRPPGDPWLDPRLAAHVAALADAGLPASLTSPRRAGRPAVAGARRRLRARSGAPTCTPTIDTTGRTGDRRGDFDSVYGDWAAGGRPDRRGAVDRPVRRHWPACGWRRRTRRRCCRREHEAAALALFDRRRLRARRALPASPTTCAATPSATTSRTWSTATSTSPTSATSAAGSARSPSASATPTRTACRSTQVADRAEEAWACRRHRGLHAGRHRPEAAGDRVRRDGAGDQGAGAGHARARLLARWRS